MVYQGPSRACQRCKDRHIKCDETRPACRNCMKRQFDCPGYAPEPGIRFQDETSSTINQARQRERRRLTRRPTARETATTSRSLPENTEAVALKFFFDNYATLGRGAQSSQGLFELIKPIYQSALPSSAMSHATLAVALTLTSEWYGKASDTLLAIEHLDKATSLLKLSTTVDSALSLADETMMAILLLKYHDMLVACKNLEKVPERHVNGARALVKYRLDKGVGFESDTSKRLLQYVRHTAVACAIQHRTKLDMESEVWKDPERMLKNPCIDLDWIGVGVANLRASDEVRHMLQLLPTGMLIDEEQTRDVRYVLNQARSLEIRLTTWAEGLSGRWLPINISNTPAINESIHSAGVYKSSCHVYPSAQVAHIRNLHREYCLHVLELLLRCEALSASSPTRSSFSADKMLFQEFVDDLCASVPFLLGNRLEPGSMEDFDLTTGIKFPEHVDDGKPNVGNLEKDMFMTEEERWRSLLAQGAWRLHDHFSLVLEFVNGEMGQALSPILRPGQTEWIQEQIQRILKIQRIERKGKGPESKSKILSTSTDTGVGTSSSAGKAKGKGKGRARQKDPDEADEGV